MKTAIGAGGADSGQQRDFQKTVDFVVVEIVRMACRGEKLVYEGEHYVLPRPGGEGKALRLSQPPNPRLPIWLATLSPRGLELTGELADG